TQLDTVKFLLRSTMVNGNPDHCQEAVGQFLSFSARRRQTYGGQAIDQHQGAVTNHRQGKSGQ
ncbi:MAG: hypothetical protein WAN86_13715, partial [Hyphomicrobiaceae bacterium]